VTWRLGCRVEHLGFLNGGDLQQLRLDFVQLDPVPADFHLMIDPRRGNEAGGA
jgi:hypothetical protein